MCFFLSIGSFKEILNQFLSQDGISREIVEFSLHPSNSLLQRSTMYYLSSTMKNILSSDRDHSGNILETAHHNKTIFEKIIPSRYYSFAVSLFSVPIVDCLSCLVTDSLPYLGDLHGKILIICEHCVNWLKANVGHCLNS